MATDCASGARPSLRPHARLADGTSVPLPLERYLGPADATDEQLLDGLSGPVLDVGCGPGRHLRALAARGVFALGVDLSPVAVELAVGRRRPRDRRRHLRRAAGRRNLAQRPAAGRQHRHRRLAGAAARHGSERCCARAASCSSSSSRRAGRRARRRLGWKARASRARGSRGRASPRPRSRRSPAPAAFAPLRSGRSPGAGSRACIVMIAADLVRLCQRRQRAQTEPVP